VELREVVGVIAGQSIGDLGTQITLCYFSKNPQVVVEHNYQTRLTG
jgi:hypothetical protein